MYMVGQSSEKSAERTMLNNANFFAIKVLFLVANLDL